MSDLLWKPGVRLPMRSLALSIQPKRRWPLYGVLVLCGLWVVAVAASAILSHSVPLRPGDVLAIVMALLPPACVALLVIGLLPAAGRTVDMEALDFRLERATSHANGLRAELDGIDAALLRSAEHTEALVLSTSAEANGLAATARALDAAAEKALALTRDASSTATGLIAALPSFAEHAAEADASLRRIAAETATQVRGVDTMLASVRARHNEAAIQADAAIATMTALLARIEETSARNTDLLSKRSYALDAAVDGVLERSTEALDQIREQVALHGRAMQDSIAATAQQLKQFGDDGSRVFSQRIDLLLRTAGQLQQQFETQDAHSERLTAEIARRLAELEDRLTAFQGSGETMGSSLAATMAAHLVDIGRQIADVHGGGTNMVGALSEGLASLHAQSASLHAQLAALQPPLASSQAALDGLDTSAGALHQSIAAADLVLGQQLATTGESLDAIAARARTLLENVGALHDAMTDGAALVGDAAAQMAGEGNRLVELSAQLAGEFDTARAALDGIRDHGVATAAKASQHLLASVEGIGAAAATTADQMRDMFAGVVAEAEQALQAGASRAETAFGEPVRAQIAAVEAAADKAAAAAGTVSERLTRQILGLATSAAEVEARIAEADARFAVRARDTLAARSEKLVEALNLASVDVARLLSIDVGDSDWQRWLKGDRSVFSRAVARGLDKDSARRIARLHQHDPEFRDEAKLFLDTFETLMKRVTTDPDGDNLATTLLSSDLGRIYAALARSTGRRPLPTAAAMRRA